MDRDLFKCVNNATACEYIFIKINFEVRDLILVDVRKYKKWMGMAMYSMLVCIIILLTYRTIETRTDTFSTETKYKEYTGINNRFSYALPENWKVEEQKIGGNEILYHSNYVSDDKKISGYVQVWDLKKPLLDFLKEGEKSAAGIVSFKYYTIKPVKIDGKDGYILEYSRKAENGRYIKAFEVFLKDKESLFYRFTFYMDEQLWKDEYREPFLNIASMAKLK